MVRNSKKTNPTSTSGSQPCARPPKVDKKSLEIDNFDVIDSTSPSRRSLPPLPTGVSVTSHAELRKLRRKQGKVTVGGIPSSINFGFLKKGLKEEKKEDAKKGKSPSTAKALSKPSSRELTESFLRDSSVTCANSARSSKGTADSSSGDASIIEAPSPASTHSHTMFDISRKNSSNNTEDKSDEGLSEDSHLESFEGPLSDAVHSTPALQENTKEDFGDMSVLDLAQEVSKDNIDVPDLSSVKTDDGPPFSAVESEQGNPITSSSNIDVDSVNIVENSEIMENSSASSTASALDIAQATAEVTEHSAAVRVSTYGMEVDAVTMPPWRLYWINYARWANTFSCHEGVHAWSWLSFSKAFPAYLYLDVYESLRVMGYGVWGTCNKGCCGISEGRKCSGFAIRRDWILNKRLLLHPYRPDAVPLTEEILDGLVLGLLSYRRSPLANLRFANGVSPMAGSVIVESTSLELCERFLLQDCV
ncbi:hypothetical protein BC829DRAFT_87329 [Chytridium lagenaria]|nr:hypothetical protein BC829DRAFT_87329 [Chytridium lagenaria]